MRLPDPIQHDSELTRYCIPALSELQCCHNCSAFVPPGPGDMPFDATQFQTLVSEAESFAEDANAQDRLFVQNFKVTTAETDNSQS